MKLAKEAKNTQASTLLVTLLGWQDSTYDAVYDDPDRDARTLYKMQVKLVPGENRIYTTKHKGTGLGMTICKRLVEMHHGSIQIESAVGCGTSVLITGESGTGKELAAKAVHFLSDRRENPLMTVNFSALTETLIESELFGHEKGAFTDARSQRKGVFELADTGTIFLGDISPKLQVKLLRVVSRKRFSGSAQHRRSRLISALSPQQISRLKRW